MPSSMPFRSSARQREREEFRKHLALLKAAPNQKHRVPPAEALGTPPPLPPKRTVPQGRTRQYIGSVQPSPR